MEITVNYILIFSLLSIKHMNQFPRMHNTSTNYSHLLERNLQTSNVSNAGSLIFDGGSSELGKTVILEMNVDRLWCYNFVCVLKCSELQL